MLNKRSCDNSGWRQGRCHDNPDDDPQRVRRPRVCDFVGDVKEKPERVPLSQIKLLPSDPAAEAATEEIKKRYSQYSGI